MILTQSHTTANHQEACFQPTVFQCNFMIEACYDAPHFGENLQQCYGEHSQTWESSLQCYGKHSPTWESSLQVYGKHSPTWECLLQCYGKQFQTRERLLQCYGIHSQHRDGILLKNANYFLLNNE